MLLDSDTQIQTNTQNIPIYEKDLGKLGLIYRGPCKDLSGTQRYEYEVDQNRIIVLDIRPNKYIPDFRIPKHISINHDSMSVIQIHTFNFKYSVFINTLPGLTKFLKDFENTKYPETFLKTVHMNYLSLFKSN